MKNTEKTIEIAGRKYTSYHDACSSMGLNYNTLAVARRRQKMSWEEIILEYLNNPPREIIYRDVRYKSVAQLCECYHLNYKVFNTNKNSYHLTVQETADYMLSRKIVIDDLYYDSYAHACRYLGINYNSITKYLQKHPDCTWEEAIIRFKNMPSRSGDSRKTAWSFTYNGVTYESLTDACRKFGYSLSQARSIKHQYCCSNQEVLDRLALKHQKKQ